MEFYNNLVRKVTENKAFYPFVIILFYLLYTISAGSTPFGDDYVYIFKNSHVTNTPHPLVFWDLTSDSYKSWPLTYSVFWLLFKVFGSNFFLYRLVNASLHLLNANLVKKIVGAQSPIRSRLVFLLFLFHPLAVENIFWIFQLKTLLATTFILLSYLYLHKSVNKTFLFFILSLFTKSIALLFPLLIPSRSRTKLKNTLIIVPFLVVSAYVGIQNIKGITASETNTINVQEFYSAAPNYEVTKEKIRETVEIQTKREEISLTQKYLRYFISFFPSQIAIKTFGQKSISFFTNLGFYVRASLGLAQNWMVYPEFSTQDSLLNIIFCLGYLSLFFLVKASRQLLFASILFYIPTSGVFYVPYMEHSPVADHWFYTSLAFLLIAVSNIKLKAKFSVNITLSLFLILLIGMTTFNNIRLSKTNEYFFENLKVTPRSKLLLEYLIQIELEKKNYRSAEILTNKLLVEAHNKIPIYQTLLFIHLELQDIESFKLIRERYFNYLDSLGLTYFKSKEMKAYSLSR